MNYEKELEAAFKKATAALKKSATVENIRAAEAARKALDAYRAETAAQADPAARRLKTLLGEGGVLDYLKAEGWKVEKTKLNADRRKIAKEKDGTYTIKAVDEYARLCLQKLDGSDQAAPGLADRKARLEVEILEEKKKEAVRENEIEAGKLILRSEVEQKHTAKLALLLIAVDNFIRGGKLDEAVEMVGGARDKMAEFRAFLKREFRALLGEYAKKPEFAVPKQAAVEAEEMIRDANPE